MKFDKGAAEAKLKEVDGGKVTDSMELFWEFVTGMQEFLGFNYKSDPDDKYTIAGVMDHPPTKAKILGNFQKKFAAPVTLYGAAGGDYTVDHERAVSAWTRVREAVRHNVEKGLNIVEDTRWDSPAGVDEYFMGLGREQKVRVNPRWARTTFIRRDSGWSWFWIALHEILHLPQEDNPGFKDATTGQGITKTPDKKERSQLMSGQTTSRSISLIGDLETQLNVIRAAFELPVRTNYADQPPSSLRKGAGAIFFSDSPTPGGQEYVGSVIVDPRLPKSVHGQATVDLYSDKDRDVKAAIAAKRTDEEASTSAEFMKMLSPGLSILKFSATVDGVEQSIDPGKLSITPQGKVSGSYRYTVNGAKRKGVVSGGQLTITWHTGARNQLLDANELRFKFDWNESGKGDWSASGTAELILVLTKQVVKYLEYGTPFDLKGTRHSTMNLNEQITMRLQRQNL
jgi:hypothetical protein